MPGVDLELRSQPGGVKETLVLRSAEAPREYLFPLSLRGLAASVDGGEVRLTDAAGQVRAVFPAGYMVDAAGAPAPAAGVTYRLVPSGGGTALRVTLDERWLRDPARRYPVRVDPTVTGGRADSGMTVHGGSSTSGASELLVGNLNGASAA